MFQVSMDKFSEFLKTLGYTKKEAENRLVFTHPFRPEFSCNNTGNEMIQFEGENENCGTVLFNLGVVNEFKTYFNVAS